jgi:hypothetical protein
LRGFRLHFPHQIDSVLQSHFLAQSIHVGRGWTRGILGINGARNGAKHYCAREPNQNFSAAFHLLFQIKAFQPKIQTPKMPFCCA